MDPKRWNYFRVAFVVGIGTAGLLIFDQGGFDQVTTVGAVTILILAIAAFGFALYRYVRSVDDPDRPLK